MEAGDRSTLASALGGAPLRFLVAGTINTAVTLALYLTLLVVVSHPIAYSVAFVCGVGLSYVLSRTYVFRSVGGVRTVVLFPFVYVAQYLVGLGVVLAWVDLLGWPEGLASIAAVMLTLPVTFGLSRLVFLGQSHPRSEADEADAIPARPGGDELSRRGAP